MICWGSIRVGVLCLLCFLTSCFPVKLIRTVNQTGSSKLKQKQFLVEIPFQYVRNKIVIKGRFSENAAEQKYFLDTGAPTIISLNNFKANQFPAIFLETDLVSTLRYDSIFNNSILSIYPKLPELYLENLLFKEVGSNVISAKGVQKIACFAPDGIIGANIMNDAIWQIDYSRQVLTVTDNIKKLKNIETAASVKFKNSGSIKKPLVPFELNGKKYWFLLDTGSAY